MVLRRRVVHDRNLIGVETEAIDENPAFSFVLGDMHPHVLALPFVILSIGLALEWLLWGRELALEFAAEATPLSDRWIGCSSRACCSVGWLRSTPGISRSTGSWSWLRW